jgi:internalin A
MELMKLLAEQLPKIEDDEEGKLAGGMPKNSAPEELQGAALRALRKLLDKKDPQQHWGGLKKILTPEGHYLWLCDYHAKQYKV